MNFCNKCLLLPIFSIVFLGSCSSYKGFDEVCAIYSEAKTIQANKEELSEYIFENISLRVNVKEALEAHSAIFNLSPEQRYPIFKEAAENSLKRQWDCNVMKEMMGTGSSE